MNSLQKPSAIPTVDAVAPADIERAVAVITLAFSADPMTRWTYPEPAQYLAMFPGLVRAFGGGAFGRRDRASTSQTTPGSRSGCRRAKSPTRPRCEASLPQGREDEFAAVFEGMASYHPHEPHWYLPLHRRRSGRHATVTARLSCSTPFAECDQDHVAGLSRILQSRQYPAVSTAWLRSSLGTIQAGSSPQLFPMLRPAR